MTTHADEIETAGSHAFPGWALAEWADHILEQAGVGVTIVDRNGSVLFYNKWAAEHLDRKPEYLGRNVREGHHRAVTNPRWNAMLQLFLNGRDEPVRYVARPYGKDDHPGDGLADPDRQRIGGTVADCIAQGRSAGTLHTLRHLWTRIL